MFYNFCWKKCVSVSSRVLCGLNGVETSCTQGYLFEILLNQSEFRLYITFNDWYQTKQMSVWFQINRKIVYTIWIRVDLIRFRKDFSVCVQNACFHGKKFPTTNDSLQPVIDVLRNWYIYRDILTRTTRYFVAKYLWKGDNLQPSQWLVQVSNFLYGKFCERI